ncbi:MAG: exodeoxyribonuclease VII small subunit [Candidatus Nanopelagicales bacterium]
MTAAVAPEDMSYEQARDELASVVAQLEAGTTTLEESLALWERGEQLVAVCEKWLTNARERIEAVRKKTAAAAADS